MVTLSKNEIFSLDDQSLVKLYTMAWVAINVEGQAWDIDMLVFSEEELDRRGYWVMADTPFVLDLRHRASKYEVTEEAA